MKLYAPNRYWKSLVLDNTKISIEDNCDFIGIIPVFSTEEEALKYSEATIELDSEYNNIPTVHIKYREDLSIINILHESGLCTSKSEARRLLSQGGAYVDGIRVTDTYNINSRDILLQKGKKTFKRVIIT